MNKFGHFLVSGIVWIVLSIVVGVAGAWLSLGGGPLSALGWAMMVVGYGFAGLTGWHLFRMTRLQIKGMRLLRDDPERFRAMEEQYLDAMNREKSHD